MSQNAIFSHLRIFLDPGCAGRPKIARALKAAGADLVSDPRDCSIILVQGETPTGQRFLREWGGEKTVLETLWVQRCTEAGRILQQSDNWGSCRAEINSTIPLDDDPDEQQHSSLPTPRITPVEMSASAPPSWAMGQPPSGQLLAQQQHQAVFLPSNDLVNQQPQLPTNDPTSVYNMVLFDIVQRNGVLPYLQSNANAFAAPGNPPGLLPQDPPPPTTSSTSRSTSVDLKGKGRQQSGAIFTSSTGSPLSFYVALEVQKRSSLISSIKKNGGVISSHLATADYAVLSFRAKDWTASLESVLALNGTPVKAAFIYDSIEADELQDFTQYKFEVPEKLQKKIDASSRPLSTNHKPTSGSISTKPTAKSSSVKTEPPERASKAVVAPQQQTVPVITPQPTPQTEPPERPRSPTPPPVSTRVLYSANKYRYPAVEDEYAVRYAAVLFERDRMTSMNYLAKKLSQKLPHHSENAWNTRLGQNLKTPIEDVKKRAFIAYRKKAHREDNNGESTNKRPRSDQAPNQPPPVAPVAPAASTSADLEREIQLVAKYFFDGADGEETREGETEAEKDARIWAQLTRKVTCKTEESWETFYNTHHARVSEAYSALLATEN
ncbi:BRCT domain-containing protein [Mycena indigotica]|uniref:BRCT domain-containing protein n=1 Tax=Mycena indigotica TaxID=2126181 RepID=A0A8H6SVD6_9AGAR|nr:BRCT domain-containing protein [Mycena indigotica]KAF7306875.1 BRCT domain-containing protein [Mycena indigotica]